MKTIMSASTVQYYRDHRTCDNQALISGPYSGDSELYLQSSRFITGTKTAQSCSPMTQ